MSKKHKFDLTHLVHHGYLKEGEKLSFVSDPKKYAVVAKHPAGEFKVKVPGDDKNFVTVHAFAQTCLGTEPPDHAAKWLKSEKGKTLYELWQADLDEAKAA